MSKATLDTVEDLTPSILGGPLSSARGILRRRDGISASLTEVLGAVGISIFVLGGGAVGLGAAFNSSQDGKAKSSAIAIGQAEGLYKSDNDTYGLLTDLTAGDTPRLANSSDKMKLAVSDDKNNFCAAVTSGSMTSPTYWVTSKGGDQVFKTLPTDAGVTCPAA